MNHIASQTDRLFVDRPVTSQAADPDRVSSLRLICQDKTDYAEAAIRLCLMLCIPVSLVLCGMRVSGFSAAPPAAQIQAPGWSATCLVPALPTAQIQAAIR